MRESVTIEELAEVYRTSDRVCVFTGAGVSSTQDSRFAHPDGEIHCEASYPSSWDKTGGMKPRRSSRSLNLSTVNVAAGFRRQGQDVI